MPKLVKPFLKWAGGKTQLLNDIQQRFPFKVNDKFTFVEPFVGSGAVLFWAINTFSNVEKFVINDINADLINTYRVIKSDVSKLISQLKDWEKEYHELSSKQEMKKEYYYAKRSMFNSHTADNITQAGLFIFLNRTCFNGLYRVNKSGGFNVPIGSYKKPRICDEENLQNVSKALLKVTILGGDYQQTLSHVSNNSFFYLDPPYKPLSETSSFNAYAKGKFDDSEQVRLRDFCNQLNDEGYTWILSNSDVSQEDHAQKSFFDDLYSEYKINRVLASRAINSKSSKRGLINELLITNQMRAV